MVLVDTSVLIDFFKGKHGKHIEKFESILEMGIPFGINNLIYQELLQGAASPKEFQKLKTYLDTQIFYDLLESTRSYENAALIFLKCRRKGFTIRSTIDLIIAETAIENGLYLHHNDSDFDVISSVINDLKIY